jgi:hypothetical protein
LYDHDDFLCVASSTKQFKLEPDDVRKVCYSSALYSIMLRQVPLSALTLIRLQYRLTVTDLQILDGLLTYSRVNDPTFAHGDGPPPKHVTIGQEGKADVQDGGNDQIIAELNGKVSQIQIWSSLSLIIQVLILARSARFVILVEGVEGAKADVLSTSVAGFAEGLQVLT